MQSMLFPNRIHFIVSCRSLLFLRVCVLSTHTVLKEALNDGPQSGDDQRQDGNDVHGRSPVASTGNQTQPTPTAREAIEASGLNYRVELKSLATTEGTAVPQRKGVVRCDTGDVLGVVGNSYIPVQNYQAFGFPDAIVAEGGLRYHTAGALGKDERVWMLYPDPEDADNSRANQVRENLNRIFETGIGLDMPGIEGTIWTAYNAVAEWVDHHRPTACSRLNSSTIVRVNGHSVGSRPSAKPATLCCTKL